MNTVRGVFVIFSVVFMGLFYFGTWTYAINSGNTLPWLIWVFLVLPPVYGLVELFAYIVRIGGRDE